jgi:hypothetical protein
MLGVAPHFGRKESKCYIETTQRFRGYGRMGGNFEEYSSWALGFAASPGRLRINQRCPRQAIERPGWERDRSAAAAISI